MAEQDTERTEEPTPKRRGEARRKGQVAVSTEVLIVANLLAVTLTLMVLGVGAIHQGLTTFRALWQPRDEMSVGTATEMLGIAFGAGAHILMPILLAVFVSVVLAGLAQTKGNVSFYRLKPKGSTMSPAKNIKKIVKLQAVMELGKSIVKLIVVGGVIYFVVGRHISELPGLARLPLLQILDFQLGLVLEAYLSGIMALLLLALGDFAFQRWRNEKGMKMSKTEVKEEHRQSEGDPKAKGRMRMLQYDRSRSRMMEAVPDADVVVTNPQRLAIALKYRRGEMSAPRIVAKGAGFLAARIREIARESGVPILEDKTLARSLYRSVKVGQMVPERLYQAVAELLAHIYRLDSRKAAAW